MGRRLCVLTTAGLAVVVVMTSVLKNTQIFSLMPLIMTENGQPESSLILKYQSHATNVCETSQYNNEENIKKGGGFKNFTPPTRLDNYKNPCFFIKTPIWSPHITTKDTPAQLRCLPYFFIAGFQKSGTSDLWHRLVKHPDIIANHKKEPWIIHRHRHKYFTFEKAANVYMDYFKSTTLDIQKAVSPGQVPDHRKVTGEGSVDTAYCIFNWQKWPGNDKCSEPVITNADYVHQLNPDMKIIFMIRSTADRLYSDHIFEAPFFKYRPSSEDFHRAIVDAIHSFDMCVKEHNVRFCAYNDLLDTDKIRIRIGLFHIFIDDWIKVFGSNNIFIADTESTLGPNRIATYREILKFLDLRPFTPDEEQTLLQGDLVNARSSLGRQYGDMLNKTRDLLDEFYAPFNKQLSKFTIH